MKIQNERSSSVESLDRIHTFSLKNGTSKVSEKKAEIKIIVDQHHNEHIILQEP
jgi:hypothetical protein